MITDKQFEDLIKPIIDIYADIELELITSISKRILNGKENGGTVYWQIQKLNELGALNQDNIKIIAKYSGRTEKEIKDIIKKVGSGHTNFNIHEEAYKRGLIKVNPYTILENDSVKLVLAKAIKNVDDIFNIINTKALESCKQAYMFAINQSYLEVSSGIYDFRTSVNKAILKMADNGITGATYKQSDGSIRKYSLEGVVRRDVLTAVRQTAQHSEEQILKTLRVNTVLVSQHLGARIDDKDPINNHAGWQGKVYLINGSNAKYGNLYEKTGYGEIQGLCGVNCRHKFFSYYEGITPLEKPIDIKENERVYKLTQQQRYYEREVRKYKKRLAGVEQTEDEELIKKEKKNIRAKQKQLREFIEQHEELRRDYQREKVVY